MPPCGGLVDSSEIAHQSGCYDLTSTCQIITHDQAEHLSTLGGLVEHTDVPISSVGAVAVNDGDGKGGCFGLGHVVV